MAARPGRTTVESIKEVHRAADMVAAPSRPAQNRTLWHALYFPNERKVQVSFYLRDDSDPTNKDKTRIVRTDYLDFTLDKAKTMRSRCRPTWMPATFRKTNKPRRGRGSGCRWIPGARIDVPIWRSRPRASPRVQITGHLKWSRISFPIPFVQYYAQHDPASIP